MKLDAPEVTIFTNMPHTHESAAQGGPSTAPETVVATAKATPVDADQLPLVDSAASNVLKKLTWVNVKATLKTYFDTLYTNNTGTVTSVAAITLGTTGTDLSSTVATGTTTPVITLQVPSASAANRGALSAADWTTFNGKQAAGTYVTPTTLNNNSLPASFTTLDVSETTPTLGAALAGNNFILRLNGVVNKATRIAFQESGGDKWLIGNGAASENGVFEVYSATVGTGVQLARNATSWAAGSDERIKDIIEPISDAITKLVSLRTVIGKYKIDSENTRRSFLIAQDVYKVLPEAIDDSNLDKLGIRYTEVIPLLVAAIKEQQLIIQELKIRIAALEAK